MNALNLKYRKLIARIKLIHRLARILMYNSGFIYYRRMYSRNHYAQTFAKMKGSKAGKRCFIVGNGSSLTTSDLDSLIGEDCIGVNEIHRIFSRTAWRPTYYLIMDRYSKTTPEEIRDIDCETVFLGDYYCRFNKVLRKDYICLHQHVGRTRNMYGFSSDISRRIINSPTVSFAAMQIMAYMGYSEVYLLGFDHSYVFEVSSEGTIVKTKKHDAHFFKDHVPADIIGNVFEMTKAYESFRQYAHENGIIVKNATRGGYLEVFERIDLDALLTER